MRAVILAGGQGIRLQPYTMVLPKPLVPVGGRPILEHLIHRLAQAGVTRVDVCVGHLGGLIQTYLREGAELPQGLQVELHWEKKPLGTAGALRAVPGLSGSFLVMNGDVLSTLELGALMDYHHAHGALLTIATRNKAVEVSLGVIESTNGRITGYHEKPTLHYDVSMGVYAYDAAALAYLPDEPCQFPELVLKLVAADQHVASFRTDAEWYDIGTPGEYERAAAAVAERGQVFGF